ncbi:metalloregulator ArsR/SmtB family transcription factor [uncultured Paraglaciecola sp.]|uniref:ArsR/SmtB family transcription factor n=1 Tax=uncultured Paraglaciecola sp. TaxID=1765024 RepID=UPI00261ED0EF|nr:metalloregulator ArsR/SmtB family transcription factor [uncultured Paraglaciecola sp.]
MDLNQIKTNATEAEAFLKMLANKNRLMILCSLIDKKCSVTELNQLVPLSQSALSQHLAALRKAELVSTQRQAQTIYYTVSDDKVKQIVEKMYEFFCEE